MNGFTNDFLIGLQHPIALLVIFWAFASTGVILIVGGFLRLYGDNWLARELLHLVGVTAIWLALSLMLYVGPPSLGLPHLPWPSACTLAFVIAVPLNVVAMCLVPTKRKVADE